VAAVNFALNQEVPEEEEGEEEAGGEGPEGIEGMEEGDTPAAAAAAAAAPASAASAPAGRAAAGSSGGGAIGAADLAAVLGNILSGSMQQQGGQGLARRGQGAAAALDVGPSLSDVLKPEALAPLLRSPDMVERLAPFLPEGHRCA
jgi:hypothetical protein